MYFTYVRLCCREGALKVKSYSSREIIRLLKKDGWYLVEVSGDHHQYKHPVKVGKVTVIHPANDFKPKTLLSIFKQAGISPPH